MTKLPALLVASALLIAACGAAATQSSSSSQSVSIAGVHVNAGPNADSNISDITNRPNPPRHPPAAPRTSEPSQNGAWHRCGGIGVDLAGSRGGTAGPRKPLPECNIQ